MSYRIVPVIIRLYGERANGIKNSRNMSVQIELSEKEEAVRKSV